MLYSPFSKYLDTTLTKYQTNAEMLDIQRQFLVGGLYFSMTEYIMSCDTLSISGCGGGAETAETSLIVLTVIFPCVSGILTLQSRYIFRLLVVKY